MQEFSSVTASSYDADSLTPLLNAKSAEGWDVVSIVSAGTNIVAYLCRDADQTAEALRESAVAEEVVAEELLVDAAAEEAAAEDLMVEAAAEEAVADAVQSADSAPSIPSAAPAVEEPAGWAAAPDDDGAASDADDSIASLAAQVGAEHDGQPAAAEPVAAEPAAAEPAAAEPAAAAAAPAAEPAVPAGWYADPSGRFELRYWDGAAWTEHVSRAGQQFTDPPVA